MFLLLDLIGAPDPTFRNVIDPATGFHVNFAFDFDDLAIGLTIYFVLEEMCALVGPRKAILTVCPFSRYHQLAECQLEMRTLVVKYLLCY